MVLEQDHRTLDQTLRIGVTPSTASDLRNPLALALAPSTRHNCDYIKCSSIHFASRQRDQITSSCILPRDKAPSIQGRNWQTADRVPPHVIEQDSGPAEREEKAASIIGGPNLS